jgi:hypothetical protein
VFDDDNLVSCAGLVLVMTLAEQAGLSRLLDEKVQITGPRIRSGAAKPRAEAGDFDRGDVRGRGLHRRRRHRP